MHCLVGGSLPLIPAVTLVYRMGHRVTESRYNSIVFLWPPCKGRCTLMYSLVSVGIIEEHKVCQLGSSREGMGLNEGVLCFAETNH